MMNARLIWAGAILAGLMVSTPAQAVPFCTSSSGFSFGFSLGIGGKVSESDRLKLYLNALRSEGVDAVSVERWNGCLRAYVRDANGHQVMQFYDPQTLRRVE